MTKTITVTSGKGGVGKTSTSLNLAIALAQLGNKVCLFDADFGMANINILLGLQPKYSIHDVIVGDKTLNEIMMYDIHGVDVLPGSSGIEAMADISNSISQTQVKELLGEFKTLPDYDYLIFDTAAGISKHVLSFCLSATEVILVITHEPTSLTDAYGILKIITANGYTGLIKVIINRCKNSKTASSTFSRFNKSVTTFLKREIAPLGLITEDLKMAEAIRLQAPLVSQFPASKSAKCFKIIAQRIMDDAVLKEDTLVSFWQRCLGIMAGPIKMMPKPRTINDAVINSQGDATLIADEIRSLRQSIERATDILAPVQEEILEENSQTQQTTGPAQPLDLQAFLQSQRSNTP